MNSSLQDAFQSGPLQGLATLLFFFFLYLVLGFLPICGVMYLAYFLLTLPLRRSERGRFFLDLLEMGLKEGRTPETAFITAAASRDPSLGARFYLLAAYLEQGLSLSQALERVPRLLPPQVRAMLKTGERVGDVSRVLPACRQLLKDGISQVRGAINYVVLLALAVTPFAVAVPVVLRVKVLPSYEAVFHEMLQGGNLPPFTRVVFAGNNFITAIQLTLLGFLWLALLLYVGGPRLRGWVGLILPGLPDWLDCALPWRRKRLQRNFSTMLALLLDAEVPEAEALALAGESTGNTIMAHRAGVLRARLSEGVKLPDALAQMDDARELSWRLSNALRSGRGFFRALAGWHESLDAKAFQLEQAWAQVATTVLVLVNGCVVASVVIAVFLVLIQLIDQAVLW